MVEAGAPDAVTLPLEPLRNYILAQENRDGARTGAGMILPANTLGQPAFACVKDVGEDVKGKFAAGEIVVYKQTEAVSVYARGQEYLLIKSDAVIAKLRSP